MHTSILYICYRHVASTKNAIKKTHESHVALVGNA